MVTLKNSTALEAILREVDVYGYSMAMGNDTLTDVGDKLYRGALSAPEDFPADVTGTVYDAIRASAVSIGLAKGKPMKDQTPKSRNAQVAKLNCFPVVAQLAQANDAVARTYDWLRRVPSDLNGNDGIGIAGYVKTVKALVAIKAVCLKTPDADDKALRDAVVAALGKTAKKASDAVAEIAALWADLVYGNEKNETEFPEEFAALAKANAPSDPAATILASLVDIAKVFAKRESDAADALRRAAGGLSI